MICTALRHRYGHHGHAVLLFIDILIVCYLMLNTVQHPMLCFYPSSMSLSMSLYLMYVVTNERFGAIRGIK